MNLKAGELQANVELMFKYERCLAQHVLEVTLKRTASRLPCRWICDQAHGENM
jgi:hypothetical protein